MRRAHPERLQALCGQGHAAACTLFPGVLGTFPIILKIIVTGWGKENVYSGEGVPVYRSHYKTQFQGQ